MQPKTKKTNKPNVLKLSRKFVRVFMYKIYNILNNKQKRLNENFVKMNSIVQLTLINVVIVEEGIDVVWEDRVVNIRKIGVILGILEAFLEPVFAEPR